ncbi:hypothetical protein FM125_04420 [Micrococcus lylae]|uniref:Uncharacterized protein n=1 Tax=Micrococcus lylae TaxID=1273 RepID=A0A1R4IT29_9MICC|nr:hypothetical protein FM125_04420 [Micrococcus lylae]
MRCVIVGEYTERPQVLRRPTSAPRPDRHGAPIGWRHG